MTVYYQSGQVIPKNVENALCYVGKVGFITRKTWYTFFASGKLRWQQDQLLHLVKRDLLKAHTCHMLDDVWVLTESGIGLLEKMGRLCVSPVSPQFIEHDEVVANGILKLKRNNVCTKWFTERELKMRNLKQYLVQNKDYEKKYPDAIFDLTYENDPMTFAIEYERTGKSSARYRSILYQYSKVGSISLVIYIVQHEAIKKRLQGSLNYLGDSTLMQKIAFVEAREWKENPLTAPIHLKNRVINFNEITARKTTTKLCA